MFEHYTEYARRAIFFARCEAFQKGYPSIETGHILLGILRANKKLIRRLGITSAEALAEDCRRVLPPKGEKVAMKIDVILLSNNCKVVLAYAAQEAQCLKSKVVGLQHLTLGLLHGNDSITETLKRHGIEAQKLRELPAIETRIKLSIFDWLKRP
jgi:ATP-dependent Clp protease ATP-binding subunit ClpC